MENKDLLSRIWALIMTAEETEPKKTENFEEHVECTSNDMKLRINRLSNGQVEAVISWRAGSLEETYTACMGKDDGMPDALALLWYKVCKEHRRWR